jgi:hypothetical protein
MGSARLFTTGGNMRIQPCAAALGFFLLSGCVDTLDTGIPAAEIRSDPAILFLGNGESKTVTVEAFLGNEPESVRWSIGQLGAGIIVAEDTTYGRTYVGNVLTLPDRSHSRRYDVTMTDTLATAFVVSGGTGIVTISVRPPVAP